MTSSKLINYTTREFVSENELELYAAKQDDIFTPEVVERCNEAIKYLYKWVKAMVDYNKIFKETAPLRELLETKTKEV